jgi:CO/xanthine dehydrogenase Mo-binding subunit
MPSVADIPPLETVLVASAGGTGPYGAKAVGEFSNNSPPAAVANAVADAIGAHLYELPITSERVLRAMRAPRQGRGALSHAKDQARALPWLSAS